jgi:hypothetical protein
VLEVLLGLVEAGLHRLSKRPWLYSGPSQSIPPKASPRQGTAQALDIAARYLVYKLHAPGPSLTEAWYPLSTLGEAAATVARAVQRGWVVLRDEGQGRTKKRYAALTDDGRQVARKALR